MRSTLLLAAILALPAWADSLPCAATDKRCALEAARRHPTKRIEFWKDALARPAESRIGPAPAPLVELLALDNIAHGYPNQPRVSSPPPRFVEDVRAAFAELPASVRRKVSERLAGIYFVDDIGGTGFTDEARDSNGKAVAGFIVLDPTVLERHTANAWATWKEASAFKADPSWKLRATIEPPARDDRRRAIQYILLHELGHVLSIGGNEHPSWTIAPKDMGPPEAYPYFALSWKVESGKYASRFEPEFPQRKDVVFYFGPRLEANALVPTYDALARTNFPTLYAATHPADDFAEAFANYVHVVMMKRPFTIEIEKDGRVVSTYRDCWREARCAAKKAYLEGLLGR